MRQSGWTPSIVPTHEGQTVYLVVDDLGRLGRVWRETSVDETDLETVIQDLLHGQYYNPICVFGFNPWEGWSRDVSADVAQELRRRCDLRLRRLPESIVDFVKRHEGRGGRQLTLRLG
jgi:hypothetical protein